jgi:hypothetical protein
MSEEGPLRLLLLGSQMAGGTAHSLGTSDLFRNQIPCCLSSSATKNVPRTNGRRDTRGHHRLEGLAGGSGIASNLRASYANLPARWLFSGALDAVETFTIMPICLFAGRMVLRAKTRHHPWTTSRGLGGPIAHLSANATRHTCRGLGALVKRR